MKKYNLGISNLLAVLLVVLAAVIAGGGVWWWMNQKLTTATTTTSTTAITQKTTTTTTSQIDISGWKTYTNTEYGYQFKYPKDWGYISADTPADWAPGGKTTQITFQGLSEPGVFIINHPIKEIGYENHEVMKEESIAVPGSTKQLEKTIYLEQKKYIQETALPNNLILVLWNNTQADWAKSGQMSLSFTNLSDEKVAIFDKILTTFRFL